MNVPSAGHGLVWRASRWSAAVGSSACVQVAVVHLRRRGAGQLLASSPGVPRPPSTQAPGPMPPPMTVTVPFDEGSRVLSARGTARVEAAVRAVREFIEQSGVPLRVTVTGFGNGYASLPGAGDRRPNVVSRRTTRMRDSRAMLTGRRRANAVIGGGIGPGAWVEGGRGTPGDDARSCPAPRRLR